jgi:thioredoxin-like negative regulator of GroEL
MLTSLLMVALEAAEPTVPFEQLVKETSAAHQPIVLEAFTSWCKPCKLMEQQVFSNPAVKTALKQVRLARYDTERGDGVEVARRFEISTWPTVLVLTPDGTLVGKIGSQEAASFIAELAPLERLAAAPGPFTAEALARPDADPRSLLIGGLLASRQSPPDEAGAQALFERAAARDADGKAGVRLRATSLAAQGRYLAALTALKVKTLFDLARGGSINALGALSFFDGHYDRAQAHGVGSQLTTSLAANPDALNNLVYAQLALHDFEGALASAKALEALNPDPLTLDTVAEASFQAGQRERAVAIEEKVVAATKNAEMQKNLERFKSGVPSPPPWSNNPLTQFEAAAPTEIPPDVAETLEFGAAMADACRAQATGVANARLRLHFKPPNATRVERATSFDLETPAPLRKCLEKAALARPVKALAEQSPVEVIVRFTP